MMLNFRIFTDELNIFRSHLSLFEIMQSLIKLKFESKIDFDFTRQSRIRTRLNNSDDRSISNFRQMKNASLKENSKEYFFYFCQRRESNWGLCYSAHLVFPTSNSPNSSFPEIQFPRISSFSEFQKSALAC